MGGVGVWAWPEGQGFTCRHFWDCYAAAVLVVTMATTTPCNTNIWKKFTATTTVMSCDVDIIIATRPHPAITADFKSMHAWLVSAVPSICNTIIFQLFNNNS